MIRFGLYLLGIILVFQLDSQAQTVDAYFDYAAFFTRETGPYVETYISFKSKSLEQIINSDSVPQASVEVTMLFSNADEVKEYRKFKLVSTPLFEGSNTVPDFIDLQRIAIPEGIYNFQLIVKDNYAADTAIPYKTSRLITVNIPEKEMALSGIEFVEKYELSKKLNIYIKDSFECIPYVSDVFNHDVNYLRFYAELYNSAENIGGLQNFFVDTYIEEIHTSKPMLEFKTSQQQQALSKNTIFKEINIKNLTTGNYYLVVEIYDIKKNLLLSSKKFFQRVNATASTKPIELKNISISKTFVAAFTNTDSLSNYIKAMKPIADINERLFIESQLQTATLKLMQQFFYSFWEARNTENPAEAWNEYLLHLKTVEQTFKTNKLMGFETERGRVYLQFGSPNSLTEKLPANGIVHHQIWNYYNIADQTDINFIFYNKTGGPNDFDLLHSNLKGEKANSNWQFELFATGWK